MRHLVLASLVFYLLTLTVTASSEVPKMINFQGKITDSGGTPVSDGTYSTQFELYDAESGGLPEWQSGAVSVEVNGGFFHVMLGESPQDSIELAFDKDYWLQVTVEGDVQSPRQRIGSVAYAYMASGLVPGTVVSGEAAGASGAVFAATNTASTGMAYGLYGETMSSDGVAVRGRAWSVTGQTYGGYFEIDSPSGAAVAAIANSSSGSSSGIFGATASTTGAAVYGFSSATTGTARAVYGQASCTTAYAGYFDGNTNIQGDLTVSGTINASGMGDITAVTAGTGLTGGGTSGDVTLNIAVPLSLTSAATDPTIEAANTATYGTAYGIYATSASTAGAALYGLSSSVSGLTRGVSGVSSSYDGTGVYGYASSTWGLTYGVYGRSDASDGAGVSGYAAATSGLTYGVRGSSASTLGRGVHGYVSATTGINYGVYGETSSTVGSGVYGFANSTTGINHGVSGKTSSTAGSGVYGYASTTTGYNYGVYGESPSTTGRGVYGYAPSTTGSCNGVHGESDSPGGAGVYGYAPWGVHGATSSAFGRGVCGWSWATTGTVYGVYGINYSDSGYGVYYQGGLGGSGSKSCIVMTSQGPTALYCQESPENWFEDFGEGQLVNGRAHIELDPLFLETVTIGGADPMKVFVELGDDCNGVFVRRGLTSFDVIELRNGASSVPFCYRVVAKRKGFEDKRLDYCKAAETDSYLYPELREKELRELEEERSRLEERRRRMEHERHRHEEARASRALAREPVAEAITPPLD